MKKLPVFVVAILLVSSAAAQQSQTSNWLETLSAYYEYIGRLSANPYASHSTSNPYGTYGSPYSSKSINNPYSSVGSAAQNPYSMGSRSPLIIGDDGTYLGRLNRNPYDPESVANPYGKYGSPYSSLSINNPYGKYGSSYSAYSATNPYTSRAPKLFAPKSFTPPRPTLPTLNEYNLPSLHLWGVEP